jgi:hypothetical protein
VVFPFLPADFDSDPAATTFVQVVMTGAVSEHARTLLAVSEAWARDQAGG